MTSPKFLNINEVMGLLRLSRSTTHELASIAKIGNQWRLYAPTLHAAWPSQSPNPHVVQVEA